VHEQHAVDAVVRRLTAAGLTDVTEVRIRAGAAFAPEALHQAYEMLTLGTPLEGSRLLVEPAEDACVCASCGHSWVPVRDDLAGHLVLCPSCGAASPLDDVASVQVIGISP
jgi:Zn finger protein HypA/HybF involved in hydrogenase expression